MGDSDKAAYWFDGAEYDLQTARAMEMRQLLYVGFMCRQTIEKALKRVLVARKSKEELPYIHANGCAWRACQGFQKRWPRSSCVFVK